VPQRRHARLVTPLIVVLLVVPLASCGSNGDNRNPIAPSPTPLVLVPEVREVSFTVQDGVDPVQVALVRKSIDIASAYLEDTFSWFPSGLEVLLTNSQGPPTATAGGGRMTIHTRSPGWLSATETKPKIVLHEMFHVLQARSGWNPSRPTWLLEGTAELIGFRGTLIASGRLTEEQVRNCHVYAVTGSSEIQPLQNYETSIGSGGPEGGPVYSLFYLAADRLLLRKDLQAFRVFSGFESTFGITQSTFYSDFAAYRNGLSRPARYECPP
jgi:hypothetical protein